MCQRDQWNIQIWQLQDFPLFVRGEPETNQMRRKPSPREFVQCHVYGLRLVDIKFYKNKNPVVIQIYSLFHLSLISIYSSSHNRRRQKWCGMNEGTTGPLDMFH